jgi:hypothetical protein
LNLLAIVVMFVVVGAAMSLDMPAAVAVSVHSGKKEH